MADYGFKFSKPGFDVSSATDAQLSFSSELASHSIYNVQDISIASGNASATHTHNLGYVPKVWLFILLNDGGGDYYRRVPWDQNNTGESIDYYITSTTLVIQVDDTTVDYDFVAVIFTRSPNI